jgi:hypothetical protein
MSSLQITPTTEKMKKQDMIDLILTKKKTKRQSGTKEAAENKKGVDLMLFKIMDDHKHIWDDCQIFLVERQMTINKQALKLSHYLEAYLKIHYPEKKIINYNSSFKTKKLGAVRLKTKLDRKKWTISYTKDVLKGDNLKYFESLKKQDDIADVVCMIESY